MKTGTFAPKLGNHMKRKLREQARTGAGLTERDVVDALAGTGCVCDEIDEKDRPCLVCEADAAKAQEAAPGAPKAR